MAKKNPGKYTFIPGLKLSERFHQDAVKPIMKAVFPDVEYSIARLGYGSDVLKLDTPMSMDHGWGPKLTLYLSEDQYEIYHDQLDEYFSNNLPLDILGFPTNFAEPLIDGGVMSYKDSYPIHHMITITTPKKWFHEYLGVDINQPLDVITWLTIPQQRLATLQSGEIFHDGLGKLESLRKQFHWYPHNLWLYLLACQWKRIDQDEPFVGRTGSVGDESGSRLIAARLVQDLMHLGFLMSKTFFPYHKWFGSAFQRLEIAKQANPFFENILSSESWQEREKHFSSAYLFFGEMHNKLGFTELIQPEISRFYNRPFLVPHSARFTDALLAEIEDPDVKALPPYLGNIDQICDNTDILEDVEMCKKFKILYQ